MQRKFLTLVFIFVAVCRADLGKFFKNMIENLGEETTSIYFPQIDEAYPLQFLSFKVTAINLLNLKNNVKYQTDVDQFIFLVTFENPKVIIEINDKKFNPEINIQKMQIQVIISRDFKTCKSFSFTPWEKLDLDIGLISNFIPDKFLNNDFIKGFLRTLEPLFKAKISQFLQNAPISLFLEKGQINIHLKKQKQINMHDDL
ncbi:hypothetical protein TTHERM_00841300 (macronuclear) [Tetrahymena thermophila SB210]|uniref:Transmembrane protein n=1 Tax=Tetrahymena thermophila (strain SB210) TaxID=312017 RepID=I7LXY7_TETTS|nr:hypothetical protein TTHERM_00841300 [Tetrahymena thermophila SB210]EAS07004.1 hypothetical protein TTHERM_00841300 [Tetrahymena thermophila SB210]|eukprot:XP_001027246.1 hypothetical protein TTHERM_00841300 [Tetrahymena thermophila SB210]